MLKVVAAVALLLLSACASQVTVPTTRVEAPVGTAPTPGNFAAQIQTGGWALKTDSQGWTCAVWSFDTDINEAYTDAVKDVLTRSLQKVTFVPDTLTPERLAADGYDAQVVVYQGNANAKFAVAAGFFTGTASSEIALTTTLAVLDQRGLYYQQTVTGKGTGQREIFTCNTAGEAVSTAAQDAIRDIAKDIALYVRDGLNQRKPVTTAAR